MIKVRIPATTANLGPGFDCLGMALTLYNQITIARNNSGKLNITVTGPAADSTIPRDETNLVYKAIRHIFELTNEPASGIDLHLDLAAPLARGLGSSASAIAGGMFAANELLNQPLTLAGLTNEATKMEGHPDNVVPCLVGGLTVSMVFEDGVIFDRIEPHEDVRYVVFVPDYELETVKSRGVMPKEVSIKDAVFNSCRIPFVLSRLQCGNLDGLSFIMDDRLHQPYRIPLIHGYTALKEAALGAGASAVCISGAGPTVLAVCSNDAADKVASLGCKALQGSGVNLSAFVLQADPHGCARV